SININKGARQSAVWKRINQKTGSHCIQYKLFCLCASLNQGLWLRTIPGPTYRLVEQASSIPSQQNNTYKKNRKQVEIEPSKAYRLTTCQPSSTYLRIPA